MCMFIPNVSFLQRTVFMCRKIELSNSIYGETSLCREKYETGENFGLQ